MNEWYSGNDALTKTCPSCCAERGYSDTLMLRGIDEFLLEAKKVIGCESVVDDVQIETDDFPVAFPVIRDNFLTS